jgi:hypothetical protein
MTSSFFEAVVPDIGFHIASNLPSVQRDGLLSSLIASLPYGADVRSHSDGLEEGRQSIGIWLRPPVDASEAADRQRWLPPGGEDPFEVFLGTSLIHGLGSAWSVHGSVSASAACATCSGLVDPAALRLLPSEILLPQGLKLTAAYHRFSVGPQGVTLGGTWSLTERRPAVMIVQPARISAEFPNLSCMAQLRLRSTDLRPPLQVSWSADGLVANPGARSTPILFDVPYARPAQVVPKAVAVRVKDSDGLTAEARMKVQVQVTWGSFSSAAPDLAEQACEVAAEDLADPFRGMAAPAQVPGDQLEALWRVEIGNERIDVRPFAGS